MEGFIVTVRKITGIVVIASVTVLAFLAILSVWDVFSSDVSYKAIWSMILIGIVALLFFGAAALVQYVRNDASGAERKWSIGWIIVTIILLLFTVPTLFSFLFGSLLFRDW